MWFLFAGLALASTPAPTVADAVAMLEDCRAPGQCSVPCWDDAVRSTEPGPDGALQVICFRGDVPHGPVIAWHPNGRPLGVGYANNGDPHGGAVSWHANGKRASESFWVNGAHEGTLRTWHANGQLESQGEWRDNKQEGVVRFWHPNGQLDEVGTWVDGLSDGPMFSWHPNGQLRARARFKRGVRVGAWRLWYPSGKRSVVVRYKSGEPSSQRCWDSGGKQIICPTGAEEIPSRTTRQGESSGAR